MSEEMLSKLAAAIVMAVVVQMSNCGYFNGQEKEIQSNLATTSSVGIASLLTANAQTTSYLMAEITHLKEQLADNQDNEMCGSGEPLP